MQLDHLRLERDDERGVATLYFDHPEKMNRISMAARGQIRHLLEELDADPGVRVVVLRGVGHQAFSSGGDIPGFMEQTPQGLSHLHDNVAAPSRCSKPVIAAVDGWCLGVGFELALNCDVILATRRSTFGLPEVRIGMMPGSGGSQRLLRMLGPLRAKWLVMFGRRFPAEQAEAWGVISKAVDNDALDKELETVVQDLLALPPVALTMLKRTMNLGLDAPLGVGLALEGVAFGLLRATDDFAEGVQSFVEKRPGRYKGR